MMPARPSPQNEAFPMPALAVGMSLFAIIVVLMCLSNPPHVKSRMAELTTDGEAVASAARAGGDLALFPPGSVCSGQLGDGYKTNLNLALSNAGLTVSTLDIGDAGRGSETLPLDVYHLTLKASGTYENTLTALEALRHARPRLFLDSLAIRNHTSSVDLEIEGRLYCR